eukprot:scaffold40431_cov77-Phaeocystis_antarctica.AAC.8
MCVMWKMRELFASEASRPSPAACGRPVWPCEAACLASSGCTGARRGATARHRVAKRCRSSQTAVCCTEAGSVARASAAASVPSTGAMLAADAGYSPLLPSCWASPSVA